MAAPIIQVDYDRLAEVARQFGRNAEAASTLQGQVQRSAQALRAGGWQGRGSAAFFAEMDSEITPALQRLTAALREAQRVSVQIGYLMRQAEEEAAEPFHGRFSESALLLLDETVLFANRELPYLFSSMEEFSNADTLLKSVEECGDGFTGLLCQLRKWIELVLGLRKSVTIDEAQIIFNDMADEADIPFKFPADGCYARAHVMIKRMAERYGLDIDSIQKIFIEGNLIIQTDYVYPGLNDNTIEWRYHVAPLLNVQDTHGTITLYVIDPSLFDHPVTIEEWKRYMNDPDAITRITNRREYVPHYEYDDSTADQITERTLAEYLARCREAGYCH